MNPPWILDTGHPVPAAIIILTALAVDAAIGDPNRLYRAIPHPVVLIGRLVEAGERLLNRPDLPRAAALVRGGALTALVTLTAAMTGWLATRAAQAIPAGWLIEAALASTLIAFRSLHDHVRAVAAGLETGIAEGRAAVAHIVGRDPDSLDEAGIARAAIESAAENFSDGVVAPVFWLAAFGLPGLAAYKAINTLDSMIGHRTERYANFGKVAARLDDAANWLPARLAGGLIAIAALFVPDAHPGHAVAVMRRHASHHRSPNAGWPEAAMAGALGFALAGPRRYGDRTVDDRTVDDRTVDDHWVGDGRKDLSAADIRGALRLYLASGVLLAALFAMWGFA